MRTTSTHKVIDINPRARRKATRPELRGSKGIYDAIRFPHIANVLCKQYGFTAEQLGKVFGVSKRTVEDWALNHAEFKQAVVSGRDEFDGQKVEQALLKRALGYTFKEVTRKKTHLIYKADSGKVSVPAVEITETIKEIPADVKAIMFWLTNRERERWKMIVSANLNVSGQVEHKHTGVVVSAQLEKLNDAQLRELRNMVSLTQLNNSIEQSPTLMLPEVSDILAKAQGIMDAEYSEVADAN